MGDPILDEMRRERAQANTIGTQDVAPEVAAQAIIQQRQGGPPAGLGMYAPQPTPPQPIPPSVAQFAATDPARAAAVRDDHSALGFFGQALEYTKQRLSQQVKPVIDALVSGDQLNILAAIAGQGQTYRKLQEDTSKQFTAPTLKESFKAQGAAALDTLGVASGPVGGAIDAATTAAAIGGTAYIPHAKGTGSFWRDLNPFTPYTDLHTLNDQEQYKQYKDVLGSLSLLLPFPGGKAAGIGKAAGEAGAAEALAGAGGKPPPFRPSAFPLDETAMVVGADGKPMAFADKRQAGAWINTVGHTESPDQIFNVFTANNNGVVTYHVQQTGVTPQPRGMPNPGVALEADAIYKETAAADAQNITDLQDIAGKTKLHGRDPQSLQEFANQQLMLEGPVGPTTPSVHLPAASITEVWATGERPFDDMKREIAIAAAHGGDVEIPLEKYLAETTGKPFADELNQAMRARENGISVAEGKDLPKAAESATLAEGEAPAEITQYDHTPHAEGLTPEEAAGLEAHAPEIQTAVAKASKDNYLTPLFGKAKNIGMTVKQMENWGKRLEGAVAKANEKMFNRFVAQLKKERGPEFKELLAQNMATVEQAYFDRPDVQAYYYLKYNQHPNGAPLETPPVKLNLALAESQYGKVRVASLPKEMFAVKTGVDADTVAAELGFGSGGQMLDAMQTLENFRTDGGFRNLKEWLKEEVKQQAGSLTRRESGYDPSPEALQAEASAALAGPEVTDVLIAELKELATRAGLPFDKQALMDHAESLFGQMPVKQAMKPKVFSRLVNKYARQAETQLLAEKYIPAFAAKQFQIINQLLMDKSFGFATEGRRIAKRLDTWRKRPVDAHINQKHLDFIHLIIQGYGLKVSRTNELSRAEDLRNLADWVDDRNENGADIYYTLPVQTPIAEQSVATLRDQMAMLRSIAHDGREVKLFMNSVEAEDADAVRQELRDTVAAIPEKKFGSKWIEPKAPGMGGRQLPGSFAGNAARGLDSAIRTLSSIADMMDNGNPNGVFHRMLINPARTALNVVFKLEQQYYPRIKALWEAIPQELRDQYDTAISDHPFQVPGSFTRDEETGLALPDGEAVAMIRGDVVPVIMNMGNKENMQGFHAYGVDEEMLKDWVFGVAKKAEFDFAQAIGDQVFEELFPVIEANKRQRSGIGLNAVRPQELVTPFGTYAGWYFPKVNDPNFRFFDHSPDVDLKANPYRLASAPTGFEKTRTGSDYPLFLNLDAVLGNHLNQVFRQIGYGRWLQSANRFIKDPAVRSAVDKVMGKEYTKQLEPWLKDQVFPYDPSLEAQALWQKASRGLRYAAHVTWLGFNVKTGISQTAGLVASADMIGSAWVARGLRDYMQAVGAGTLKQTIFQHSEIMEQRLVAPSREALEVMQQHKSITHGGGNFLEAVAQGRLLQANRRAAEASMHYIGIMDFYGVAAPTWLGAVAKYMESEMPSASADMATRQQEAYRYADKVIEQSQGTGFQKDLTTLERNRDEWSKWATMFNTWPGRFWNLEIDMLRDFTQGRYGDGLKKWMLLFPVNALVTAFLGLAWPDKKHRKKGHELESWMKWALIKTGLVGFSGIPGLRDAASGLDQYLTGASSTVLRGGETYLSRMYDQISRTVNLFSKHHKQKDRDIATALQAIGLVTGIPAMGQIGNTIQGAVNLKKQKGKKDAETVTKELLTGRKD